MANCPANLLSKVPPCGGSALGARSRPDDMLDRLVLANGLPLQGGAYGAPTLASLPGGVHTRDDAQRRLPNEEGFRLSHGSQWA